MMYKPTITNIPRKTSYQTTFFPYKIGSSNDAKNAPVDKHAKVTETLETLIE